MEPAAVPEERADPALVGADEPISTAAGLLGLGVVACGRSTGVPSAQAGRVQHVTDVAGDVP
jgi:hypothetical protein